MTIFENVLFSFALRNSKKLACRLETQFTLITFFHRQTTKMNDEGPEYWIYHERQQAMLCGQHALNNLVQGNVFQPGNLAEIAHQLDQMELNFMAQNNEGGVRYVSDIRRLIRVIYI